MPSPRSFPFFKQFDARDCGAACLRMITRYYGRYFSLEHLRALTYKNVEGVSLLGLSDAAEKIGFHTLGARLNFERLLRKDIPLPFIAHWQQNHFVVVIRVDERAVWIADPARGILKLKPGEFLRGWVGKPDATKEQGVVLLLEPTEAFYQREHESPRRRGLAYLWGYFRQYPALLVILGATMLVGMLALLAVPFIVKALVDEGIETQDGQLVLLILGAWLMLALCHLGLVAIRRLLMRYLGMKVGVRMLIEFMMKTLRLPVRFFHTRLPNDIVRRLQDNLVLERFLTRDSIQFFVAVLVLVVFGVVLALFDLQLFLLFLAGTGLQLLWMRIFTGRIKEVSYRRYDQNADTHYKLTDLILGIEDIKLNNAEKKMRWSWERSEARRLRLSRRYESLKDWAHYGAEFIGQLKNILIIVFAALAVMSNTLSLGALLAVVYILAFLRDPIRQLTRFALGLQEVRHSLERIQEIQQIESEEQPLEKVNVLPADNTLVLDRVSFRFDGPNSPLIFEELSCEIPQGLTTAIVGPSGSGKTTLLKLLLKFYQPSSGAIYLGKLNLANLDLSTWRSHCGVVMQEGHIFADTIANNIALGPEVPDHRRLLLAARIANLQTFIDSLPRGFNTLVGRGGIGLSQGQKKRLLLARAVYKNPDFLFLDELINDLDKDNQRIILNNIRSYFKDKTVVFFGHDLAAFAHIDHMVVLPKRKGEPDGSTLWTERRGARWG